MDKLCHAINQKRKQEFTIGKPGKGSKYKNRAYYGPNRMLETCILHKQIAGNETGLTMLCIQAFKHKRSLLAGLVGNRKYGWCLRLKQRSSKAVMNTPQNSPGRS